ncbi:MAG: TorF family putative porin [Saccharospirillaceae bacterium]|nr:TorF family putative porin [Saccharospirillaceae bacterium]MCD8532747.1 TorF family putative porin [Saccharospirillaceae bacterium]
MSVFRPLHTATAALIILTATSVQAELNANLGLTSEYVRDGISQTRGNAALQGGLTFRHDSGFYTGLWSSALNRKEDHASYEHDAFAGVYLPLSDGIAVDVSATRYTFAGDADINDQAYSEGTLRLLVDDAMTLGWRHSEAYLDSGFAKRSLELGYTIQTGSFSIELFTAQHRYLEISDDFNFGSGNKDDYWQFRVGVERSYGPYDYRLSIDRTNLSSAYDAGTTLQFSVHRYFGLW